MSKRYQIWNRDPEYLIEAFKTKIEAREYFIHIVSQSPDREKLKFMGIEYQI